MQILGYYLRRFASYFCLGKKHAWQTDCDHEPSGSGHVRAVHCRISGCQFYGSSRTAGYCSVCYRRWLARRNSRSPQNSRIPVFVGGGNAAESRYRNRHPIGSVLLQSQRDFLEKHDALIAELSQKIQDHKESTPRLLYTQGPIHKENIDERELVDNVVNSPLDDETICEANCQCKHNNCLMRQKLKRAMLTEERFQ